MNTSAEPRVRRASPADAPALARLRYEFRSRRAPAAEDANDFVSRCTEWMSARLADDRRWRSWTVDRDGELVGMIWLEIVEKIPNPGDEPECHGYVTSFYMRPEHRGRGVGSEVLRAAIAECAGLEVDTIFLWPSDESRPLYARHGFKPAGALMILER